MGWGMGIRIHMDMTTEMRMGIHMVMGTRIHMSMAMELPLRLSMRW